MGRIRSVKPEYFIDGKILNLPDSTALFFVALWTICDDHGYFTFNNKELSKATARWRAQDVTTFLKRLHIEGLIDLSSTSGVGLVRGWRHQRIDKRRPSKWEAEQIQWDTKSEAGKKRAGEERKGEEGKGKESSRSDARPTGPAPVQPEFILHPTEPPKKTPGSFVWDAYETAYENRYKIKPKRNQITNTKCKSLAERLGTEDAVGVVQFFVTHNDGFYLRKKHPIWMCLQDAEGLYTQWKQGRATTANDVRNFEKGDALRSQIERIDRGEI